MEISRRYLTLAAVTVILAGVAIPVYALFKFEWFYSPKESFGGNLSSGLAADGKELWYANYAAESPDSQTVNVYNFQTGVWRTLSSGPDGVPVNVFRYIVLYSSKVLVGGSGGAAVQDRDTGKWTAYGTDNGLPSRDTYAAAMKDGEIWFGTDKGIGRMDASGTWKYYTMEDGLPNNKVLDILFDGDTVWISTENGIARMSLQSGEIKRLSKADGLPGEVGRKALIDDDYVFFAMKGGVARISRSTGEIKAYTTGDGLLSDEVKDIAVVGNKIYFATNKGVSYMSREKDGKFKDITPKQGLPKTAARSGLGSDATHLVVEGNKLWIALWYEGIVRMSIPTGLAIIPVWVYVVALAALGIAALIIIRPGAKKGEVSEKEKRLEERRKKARTEKPPHEICGGVPQRQLCNRCGFNTLKAGKLYCSKYNMEIQYRAPATQET